MTGQIQSYGKIGPTNAGDISQIRVNGNLSRGFDTVCKNKNTTRVGGIFHNISEDMGVSLEKMRI